MNKRIEVGGHRSATERTTFTVSTEQLTNGKFKGVVTWRHFRGLSVSNTEIVTMCKVERVTESEALEDAKILADKG